MVYYFLNDFNRFKATRKTKTQRQKKEELNYFLGILLFCENLHYQEYLSDF